MVIYTENGILQVQIVNEHGLIQTYQSLFSVVIATVFVICGWYFSHRFTLRAQRMNLLNQMYISARPEITEKLRDYQKYLLEMEHLFAGFYIQQSIEIESLRNILKKCYSNKWILILEEYQGLISEMPLIYNQLLKREKIIYNLVLDIQRKMKNSNNDKNTSKELANEIVKYIYLIHNQNCLIDDVLIYIQNFIIAKITNKKIHKNLQGDSNVDRSKFVIEQGNLLFIDGDDFSSKDYHKDISNIYQVVSL